MALREIVPGNARVQNEDDAVYHLPILRMALPQKHQCSR